MNATPTPPTGLTALASGGAEDPRLLGVRHPDRLRLALAAWRRAIDPHGPPRAASVRRAVGSAQTPSRVYRAARRNLARTLLARGPEAERFRLPLAPRLTVWADAWTLEGWNAAWSTYARITVPAATWAEGANPQIGVTRVDLGDQMGLDPDSDRGLTLTPSRPLVPADAAPPGWVRGLTGLMGALALPGRRLPVDRGGLLGLLGALGPNRPGGRSVVVRWGAGGSAWTEVAGRSVSLHAARRGGDGPSGSAQIPVGPALEALGDLLPEVEGAEVRVDPLGTVGTWSVALRGGIRLVVAQPAWTLDGRLGALRLDALAPPVEAGRFLLNQVVACLRERPSLTRREIIERTRGNPPAVLAALYRLAHAGLILPEPEGDRLRWRPDGAPPDAADDPEPAEITAARAITQTASIRVERDEALPGGRGRRVAALILDRPTWVDLDPDGWLRRGACTCSHHAAQRLTRGPCRHLLALQARIVDGVGLASPPADLASWFATLGSAL